MTWVKLLVLSVILAGGSIRAEDVIYLRSGEVLQGKILGQDPYQQSLYFRFSDGREFRIRNSDIQQVGAPQNFGNVSPYPNYPNPYFSSSAPQVVPMSERNVSSVNRQTQETTSGKSSWWDSLRWGFRAGLNSANVKLSDASKASSVSGASVSVLAEVPVWGRLSVQGELGYSQYGFSGTLSGESVKLNYNVMEAQVLGKLRLFNTKKSMNVSLLGGVAPAYRASAKVSSGTLGLDANTYSKKATASGVIGATVSFRVGKSTELGLDVRQLIGLTNMSANDVSAKNATTFVGASLIF